MSSIIPGRARAHVHSRSSIGLYKYSASHPVGAARRALCGAQQPDCVRCLSELNMGPVNLGIYGTQVLHRLYAVPAHLVVYLRHVFGGA
jgi:hypothetical protein